ncbi:hypothetical protein RZS08_58535, partial [Arthrospira platensis SPKY1]|nr:hypothetical protein [Arthrospira platensis SPKY1]
AEAPVRIAGFDGFEWKERAMLIDRHRVSDVTDAGGDCQVQAAGRAAEHGVEKAHEADVDRDAVFARIVGTEAEQRPAVVSGQAALDDLVGEVARCGGATAEADDVER